MASHKLDSTIFLIIPVILKFPWHCNVLHATKVHKNRSDMSGDGELKKKYVEWRKEQKCYSKYQWEAVVD
jgi:hypothetical protein